MEPFYIRLDEEGNIPTFFFGNPPSVYSLILFCCSLVPQSEKQVPNVRKIFVSFPSVVMMMSFAKVTQIVSLTVLVASIVFHAVLWVFVGPWLVQDAYCRYAMDNQTTIALATSEPYINKAGSCGTPHYDYALSRWDFRLCARPLPVFVLLITWTVAYFVVILPIFFVRLAGFLPRWGALLFHVPFLCCWCACALSSIILLWRSTDATDGRTTNSELVVVHEQQTCDNWSDKCERWDFQYTAVKLVTTANAAYSFTLNTYQAPCAFGSDVPGVCRSNQRALIYIQQGSGVFASCNETGKIHVTTTIPAQSVSHVQAHVLRERTRAAKWMLSLLVLLLMLPFVDILVNVCLEPYRKSVMYSDSVISTPASNI